MNLKGLVLDARFEITNRIDVGSHAEIFLARNIAPLAGEPEIVVVKALNLILHGELEPDLERTLIDNIALEAQTMKGFDHPNIVHLFGFGSAIDHEGKQFYYLVLEYMPGGSLSRYCGSRPLSFGETLYYTKQICSALSYAHSRGVLHRDVKPNNMMLSSNRRTVKLLDFGTARLLNTNSSITKVGTDLYAAPEHYSLSGITKDKLTPSADVYALAKTVYYMLCGKSPSSFMQQQISSLPNHLLSQPWAGGVAHVLRRATSSVTAVRHQSVWEFYEDLCAASELTVHSPRTPQCEAHDYHTKASRIVVNVAPKASRDYRKELKNYYVLLAGYAARAVSAVGPLCVNTWRWLRPELRNAHTLLSGVCLRAWRWLNSLPRKISTLIAVVVAIALLLLIVTPAFMKYWRLRSSTGPQEQGVKTSTGLQATASTDINIRSGPNNKTQKIGLAERGSRVMILSFSDDQKWCEIEVLQHGREKEIPASADRGWVNRRYLTFDH